jgi:hypothetical protein
MNKRHVRSSGFESEAPHAGHFLSMEREIRRIVKESYPGPAGDEWLQVCLRTLGNGEAGGTEGIDAKSSGNTGQRSKKQGRTRRALALAASAAAGPGRGPLAGYAAGRR